MLLYWKTNEIQHFQRQNVTTKYKILIPEACDFCNPLLPPLISQFHPGILPASKAHDREQNHFQGVRNYPITANSESIMKHFQQLVLEFIFKECNDHITSLVQ